MTLDIEAIKTRAEAATEGPWGVEGRAHPGPDEHLVIYPVEQGGTLAFVQPSWDDAEFIAHARTDVPALVAEVERLRGIVDRVREVHAPIDALNTRYNQVQKVCTGCGTDDGNWQNWPCPTIRALEGP